ncbi:hypothetical protein JZ751_011613, partial [Albula glossodonta]
MRTELILPALLLLLALPTSWQRYEDFDEGEEQAEFEDNDFAEFEDLTVDTVAKVEPEPTPQADPADAVLDDDEEEVMEPEEAMEDFEDTETQDEYIYSRYDAEEFEGFENPSFKDPINIVSVPSHLQNRWDSYYIEILLVAGLLAFITNYFIGKKKNSRLAQAWLSSHRELLESNFALVGDDGSSKEVASTGKLNKENEHIYNLWCSGRVCCEGMLIQLKLLNRQDLLSVLSRMMMRPACDQVHVTVSLSEEDMDTFVFALGTRKAMLRLQKEMQDLMVHYFTNYADKIDSIHFSDQFSGPKPIQEDGQPLKLPETKKTLLFTFNVPKMGTTTPRDMETMLPLMNMVIYCIDKIRRFRLNKEAERNRARVEENFLKQTHAQRQEAAQTRREEKKRAEKERIMNEEDPEKQRRL